MPFRLRLIVQFVLISASTAFIYAALSNGTGAADRGVCNLGLCPAEGLTSAQADDFERGSKLFGQVWASGDNTSKFNGAGPLYNARACSLCHPAGGSGHAPAANWPEGDQLSFVLRLSVGGAPHQVYGRQLQDLGAQGLKPEGKVRVTYTDTAVSFADGESIVLRKPQYFVDAPGYGPIGPDTELSPRIAPPLHGVGLLSAIPAAEITANPGIQGRFGWRAETSTLQDQIAMALSSDMGLSTAQYASSSGDCTSSEEACMLKGGGVNGAVEVPAADLASLETLVENLGAPQPMADSPPFDRQGKMMFEKTGCPVCHHETFTTLNIPGKPALSGKSIHPYSDLRRHDMGEGLADRTLGGALGSREWRTAPLWGLAARKNGLMHDGRARNIMEAIIWHGGKAAASQKAVRDLNAEDRTALTAFLNGL